MRAELIVGIAESAEINDALHARSGGGGREGCGKLAIERRKVGARLHRVHEIVSGVAAGQLIRKAPGIRQVAWHDLDRWILTPRTIAQFIGSADEAAHLVSGSREAWHQ